MFNQYTVPIVPDSLITARAHAEKLRATIARAAEANNATAGQIGEAEKAFRAECSAAALNGTAHPKTPASLRDLRERVETAENTLEDLGALLAEAEGGNPQFVALRPRRRNGCRNCPPLRAGP